MRSMRRLAEEALSRTSGAALVERNSVRLLKDADENYPAWLEAILAAKKFIHLENYIFEEDEVGWLFADALSRKAREGVRVRVVRDWLGSWGCASRSFWRRMACAGVHLRCFNPPRVDSPIGWVTRDHRKSIAIDGEVAFVAGLCLSKRWKGDRLRGLTPWRDTGVEIRGPAVADVHAAFGQVWESMGDGLPFDELPAVDSLRPVGNVALRVVAGAPTTAGMLRTDQLIAAVARQSLWLTDAYFVGIAPYVQALLAAARDGVDVRLLVPHTMDLRLVRSLSRSGFRPLLEGGIRIFEWNGSMLHAKTAVVDGRWSRIGSSNLNVASFLGNYELDVAIDDAGVAAEMQRMFLQDLDNATELVLSQNRVRDRSSVALGTRPSVLRLADEPLNTRYPRRAPVGHKGSAAAAGAIRVANAVGAAMTNRRVLGRAEGGLLLASAALLFAMGAVGILWPRVLAMPIVLLAGYLGFALSLRALRLRLGRRPKAMLGEPPLQRRSMKATLRAEPEQHSLVGLDP
jgi:cardiolipin synthase